MSSLIRCNKRHAKRPYEVARIHGRIYTMEELCYYLSNNLYLIDSAVINSRLCDWLETELGLAALAEELRALLKKKSSDEKFILAILSYSSIYTAGELQQMQNILDKLKNQNEVERRKYKADNLLRNHETEEAILAYQSILYEEPDDEMGEAFYGKIYACLGSAYGRQFLYKEAMEMYEKAFQSYKEAEIVKSYLYCARCAFSAEEYEMFLHKNPLYPKISGEMLRELEEQKREVREACGNVPDVEKIKNKYRHTCA